MENTLGEITPVHENNTPKSFETVKPIDSVENKVIQSKPSFEDRAESFVGGFFGIFGFLKN